MLVRGVIRHEVQYQLQLSRRGLSQQTTEVGQSSENRINGKAVADVEPPSATSRVAVIQCDGPVNHNRGRS